ncbi:manganese superoxide dismutase [Roridomyces roridus]|uniref:Manganese superoxide dismutase n=1 Tax=Roridomyces roridus TaxID=1738132 RepID=A0AAD7FUA6_9AGAR|nr:manganese superoxide dismutase [Roridomyces roridus]
MSFLCRCRHPLLRAARPLIPRGTRGVTGQFDHLPLPLPYNIKDGLGKFLPPPALEAVAVDYQLGLLARLTEEVRNTEDESSPVTQVVINTGPYRDKTLAFNYASLALNNSFFLGQLTPNAAEAQEDAISKGLSEMIRIDHGGLEQLKSSFSAAAMGMFTSGWVWFVTDKNGSTSILPTFGPGTLLVRSRTYMAHVHQSLYHEMTPSPFGWDRDLQYVGKYLAGWGVDGQGTLPTDMDLNQLSQLLSEFEGGPKSESPSEEPERRTTPPSATAANPLQPRFIHTSARRQFEDRTYDGKPVGLYSNYRPPVTPQNKSDTINAGETLYPLFCVSVNEHAWVSAGYGVWGKEAWLREFWNVLNWRQVSQAYDNVMALSKK